MQCEDVLREYGAVIRRVASAYAAPGPGREDLEQEIALALCQALGRWRGDAKLRTYVYRIAHNCGLAALRKDARLAREQPWEHEPPAPGRGGEARAIAREQQERLARAVRALPLSLRLPMTLRLEGLTYPEIAQILELTEGAVGVRLHRATAALRELMKES